VTDD